MKIAIQELEQKNKKIEDLGKPKLTRDAVSPQGKTIQKPFNLTNRSDRVNQIQDKEKRPTPDIKI